MKNLQYSTIPNELKTYCNWCCWKTELRDDKPTKIPIDAKTGRNAESNNPSSWSTYDKVVEYYEQNLKSHFCLSEAGIGFFFSDSDPYTGIDLDDCVENLKLNSQASAKIEKLNSYTEFSPSWNGTHTIVKAVKPGDKCRTGKVDWCSHVEMYDKLRYFTFTGHVMQSYDTIKSRQKELTEFYNELFVSKKSKDKSKKQTKTFTKKNFDDQNLLDLAFRAKNGEKFKNLWTGNWQAEGYPSQSEADLAFCELLAFWTRGDRARIDRLFRQSGLYREKWDRKDYRDRTIDKALESQTEYYEPRKSWTINQKQKTKKEKDKSQKESNTDKNETETEAETEQEKKKESNTDKNETETEAETEQEKKKEKKKKGFYPTAISKRLLAQNSFIWQYVTEQDQFYQYQDGVWTQIVDGYIEKAIRNILLMSPSWDRRNKRTEIMEALKDFLIDPAIQRRFDVSTNPNFDLINVNNGMIDWRTGELKPHDKEYYSTCQLNVTYDPEAESDLWRQCLKEWIPDPKSRLFIQEFSGYCLIPNTKYHRAVILVGAGSNGKSTFLYTNEKLFGEDNLSSIPMRKLSERFEIARIQHKLVNICADIESGYIEHTSNIKKIISGDTLRGELKYKPSFDFTPITRLWFSCNEIPKASDRSEAWYRRFEYVTFPNRFEGDRRDPQLKQKLTKTEVLSAVLNWTIAGLRRLKNQGEFTISDKMIATKELYELENDNTAAFIDEMLDFPVDNKVPKAWLYQQYVDHCKNSGTKPLAKTRFETRLKANGFDEKKTSIKICSLHRDFRCEKTDEYGNVCDPNEYEITTRACWIGLDLRD